MDVHAKAFRALSKRGVPVIWQTNFHVHAHTMLTNRYLHADYLCQKLIAQKAGIVIGDIPEITGLKDWHSNGVTGDWHLSSSGKNSQAHMVVAAMLRFLEAAVSKELQGQGVQPVVAAADASWVVDEVVGGSSTEAEDKLLLLLRSVATP